jgi:hypothetical protein
VSSISSDILCNMWLVLVYRCAALLLRCGKLAIEPKLMGKKKWVEMEMKLSCLQVSGFLWITGSLYTRGPTVGVFLCTFNFLHIVSLLL